MKKITKREYNNQMNELKDELQAVIGILESLLRKYENNIAQYEIDYSENTNYWNEMHDAQYDIEKQIEALENRWSKRNWTHQDYAQWDLVTSNID